EDRRSPDTAVPFLELGASEFAARTAFTRRRTIVAMEQHEGIVFDAQCFERGQDPADAAVHAGYHGFVGLLAGISAPDAAVILVAVAAKQRLCRIKAIA